MQFGAFVPQGWRLDLVGIDRSQHWPTMTAVAQTIEGAGYDSLWVFDHFHTVPVPTQEATYEAWTLMAALATVTTTVRLGQMCTCNSYRSPAYLAKVAASIDVISNGRLEMGIGAGWYEHEYDGYGYEFAKPSVRIGQLGEGVEIMKRMWTEEVVDFAGEHYQLRGGICQPKPVQEPHIPIWVAGGGEQLTLRVAARHAAYTNFGQTLDEFVAKSEILRAHCDAVGREYETITRTSNFTIICAETEADVAERVGWMRDHYRPFLSDERLESAMRMYAGTTGTPDQLVEQLLPWKRAGAEYLIVNFPEAAYDTGGLELFASQVAPALA
ncbi:MAG TPA: LLM class F420-dependent oxidoreductase [Acidimicrobiia bacterium]|jgi:F420-dependent oxidoreductase-like protein